MAKAKQVAKTQGKNWAIIALFLIAIVSNFWWWSISTVRDEVEQELRITDSRQGLVNLKLKECIDKNITPCDISIQFQQ